MSTISVLEQFSLVRRLLNRLAMLQVKGMDLGPKQMHVLRFIHKNGKCSMRDIADGISSDKASVTRMVNSLVNAKYLLRSSSENDLRETLVSLAPKAKPVVAEIEKIYQQLSEQVAGGLSPKEREVLISLLKKIEIRVHKSIDTMVGGSKSRRPEESS